MFKRSIRLLQQLVGPNGVRACSCSQDSVPPIFNPKKILILTKLSRYEFEKQKHRQLNERELKRSLTVRGSDYQMLLHRYKMHKNVESSVVEAFQDFDIDTRVVNRFNYTDAEIEWADAIVTTGGDGTYLLAASRILNCDKPVIGFNSDPSRSKGQLCLPEKYSYNAKDAVQKLLQGLFRWQFRSRIRITLIGHDVDQPPVELHDQQLEHPENRYLDIDQQLQTYKLRQPYVASDEDERNLGTRVLPVLALNEVFIGECVSARVSYLEIKFDGEPPVKQKCSGLIVSTGTGSTSWTYNVNKLTEQSLEQILNITQEETGHGLDPCNSKLITTITDKFNELLLNDPEDNRLVYTIRDQIVTPVFSRASTDRIAQRQHLHAQVSSVQGGSVGYTAAAINEGDTSSIEGSFIDQNSVKPRGFAQRIHVRSRCFDAFLVIDGGMSFSFNDGTRALLEMHPEDALRNVVLLDSQRTWWLFGTETVLTDPSS